jgi:hypothetical protein
MQPPRSRHIVNIQNTVVAALALASQRTNKREGKMHNGKSQVVLEGRDEYQKYP